MFLVSRSIVKSNPYILNIVPNTWQIKNHNHSPPTDETNKHVQATEVGSLMNWEWYEFDSLYAAPQHLTNSSLAARGAQIQTNPNKNREPI
jgi:hypothetical protein